MNQKYAPTITRIIPNNRNRTEEIVHPPTGSHCLPRSHEGVPASGGGLDLTRFWWRPCP